MREHTINAPCQSVRRACSASAILVWPGWAYQSSLGQCLKDSSWLGLSAVLAVITCPFPQSESDGVMAQSDSLAQHQQEGAAESETVHAGQMPSVPHAAEGPSCESCARRSNANMSSHAAAAACRPRK